MDKIINQILLSCGAAEARTLSYDDIREEMSSAARGRAEDAVPGLSGLIIAAFPYYYGPPEGNIALYAQGEDYHRAVMRRLDAACAQLQEHFPSNRFRAFVDTSPIPEKLAAQRAGLGFSGRNGLIFLPPYGSFIFLGEILTDFPLFREGIKSPLCPDCGACVRICPTGAIDASGVIGPLPALCLSGLSQRKGALTTEEEQALSKLPTIWGCDLCQIVCPLNRDVIPSPLPDLTGCGEVPYLSTLRMEDLEGLGKAEFRNKYGNRAFSWRGPEVLRRNLLLTGENKEK